MKSEKFDQILDEVIDRIAQGESVDDCLQDYPEHAKELEPLLRVASRAYSDSDLEPRPEFKKGLLAQTSILPNRKRPRAEPRRLPLFSWQLRWVAATVAVLILLMVGASGTAAASSGSMPDDTLYPVKLAVERARLTFTFSDTGKAKLHVIFAERRAKELAYMAEKGDAGAVEKASSRLDSDLASIESWASGVEQGDGGVAEVTETLQETNVAIQAVFQEAAGTVESEAEVAFEEAVTNYNDCYGRALQAMGQTQGNGSGSGQTGGNGA